MLFDWFKTRDNKEKQKQEVAKTAVPVSPTVVDGSILVDSSQMAGYYGVSMDIDSTISDEIQMIGRYRDIACYPDCDAAIEQIVNDAIVIDDEHTAVSINLENLPDQYETIKSRITEEFEKILELYEFNENCHDMFKRWYIDGRLFYFIDIDAENPKNGILELRYIDPRKIKKVTEITKENKNGVDLVKDIQTYYIFNDAGLNGANQGIKLNPNSIVDAPSGQVEANTGRVVSYLYKAIKPVNQLKMMEDAVVIYRITRAPERRIFYVDVANMPPAKAEQYVQSIMNKFRNRVQYDAITGEIRNGKNHLNIIEDFWLPRRENGRSTEITTLPAGQALDQIEDIIYFQKKLYLAMEVPRQRLSNETNFQLGRTTEITREEVIFSKFIKRLRNKFSIIFKDPLRIQLIAKNIIKDEEWNEIKNYVLFDFHQDNYFEELKENEILTERLNQLQIIDAYKGEYFSKEWIATKVLKLSEEEWTEMKKQMDTEANAGTGGSDGSGDDMSGGDIGGGDMGDTSGGDEFNPLDDENNGAGGAVDDSGEGAEGAEEPVDTGAPEEEPAPEGGASDEVQI